MHRRTRLDWRRVRTVVREDQREEREDHEYRADNEDEYVTRPVVLADRVMSDAFDVQCVPPFVWFVIDQLVS